ncbi:hypothetical protein JRO89_XS04G0070100 [Xanthoceras sorbifolium]|uniref:Uncharacterized protein n=1 Tax=Xanthoceras sorbifolium TaxID=99658 RepID=A0ABQ8I4Q6_9ROSI|nr:hypothetical protein JRO89_XS04G0070100 [Xanthoceras sorbifolium]
MDVPDLFPHGAAIPSSGRTVQRPYVPWDIPGSEGTDDVDLALDITCNGGTNVADFAQDITGSGGTDVEDHLRDIHIGDACLDLGLVKATPTPRSTNSAPPSSRQRSPTYDSMESPPPPFPPPDKGLTCLAQKLMNVDARLLDVDAQLQSFIIESREQPFSPPFSADDASHDQTLFTFGGDDFSTPREMVHEERADDDIMHQTPKTTALNTGAHVGASVLMCEMPSSSHTSTEPPQTHVIVVFGASTVVKEEPVDDDFVHQKPKMTAPQTGADVSTSMRASYLPSSLHTSVESPQTQAIVVHEERAEVPRRI